MKIAILSDINSNVYALQAVINDAKSKNVDMMINAGDSFFGPIEPRATYELLRENNFVNVCGNQDREVLEASLEQLENNPTLKYTYENLGEEVLYWIQDLPFEKFLGKDYVVWDKSAFIDYKKPARSRVFVTFEFSQEEIANIKSEVAENGRLDIVKSNDLISEKGEIFAQLEKTIFIATKNFYKEYKANKEKAASLQK